MKTQTLSPTLRGILIGTNLNKKEHIEYQKSPDL